MNAETDGPVDLVVMLTPHDRASLPELRALLSEQARRSRTEPGCLRFDVFESSGGTETFFLIERWESNAALEVHRNADACRTLYFPKVVPLVDRVAHVCRELTEDDPGV